MYHSHKNPSPNPDGQLLYMSQDGERGALHQARRQRFGSVESLRGRCARCRCGWAIMRTAQNRVFTLFPMEVAITRPSWLLRPKPY